MATYWEYRIVYTDFEYVDENRLNKLGDDRWELLALAGLPNERYQYTFRRPPWKVPTGTSSMVLGETIDMPVSGETVDIDWASSISDFIALGETTEIPVAGETIDVPIPGETIDMPMPGESTDIDDANDSRR